MSFICENINCSAPENKKGKVYPSDMECPFCDEPLVVFESISESDRLLINALPYVIAYPLKKAINENHPGTKINLLKDTFLNYLKYLALLTASEFFQSPFKDKRMVALFHTSLAEPSFGTWNQYIRETIVFLQQNNHEFFCPELPLYYQTVETGKKRKLYKGEIEFIDGNGDIQLKKQEATAIGMLINFRNRYLGHGLTLDNETANQLWAEYFPIFMELLLQMNFSTSYPMFKTEHGETFRLQSDQLQPCENEHAKQGHVWIQNIQGKTLDILPFFVVPGEVAIGKEDKEQILTYESYTGKTIKFFSPEGTEKQTSGKILERLNMLLRDKQKEQPYSPEAFTKDIFLSRVAEENKLILDTLIAEKKVIPGVYVHRQEMEIKLNEWIGALANIYVLAAEAGSGKTNLLVEMQQQYTSRNIPALLIRAGRMEKTTLRAQLCYLLNIDEREILSQYPSLAGTQDAPTFVLIDGLNEAPHSEALWQELFDISKYFEPGSLKFVVSSRANTADDINRYTITTEQASFLYGTKNDKEIQVSAYTNWLTNLSMEEMKQAWEYYVQKDKSKFKPLFDFDDLATFDRALYNQISNPLVMRLFLETYQGKNLPKKGNQHLDIWNDWLNSFTLSEQEFFKALADAIWNKGDNELLLDDVLKDENLKSYFTTNQLNAPYPRLRNLGWVSRYVKDLNSCVGFTVEGALLHLLGKKLESEQPPIALIQITKLLQTGSTIQQAGVGAYLQHCALQGDLNTVCELIDAGEEFIEVCITPIVIHLKTTGVKETLDILLQTPTENDWKAMLKVDKTLVELILHPLRKELALHVLPRNDFSSKASINLGLRGICEIDKEEGEMFLLKINLNNSNLLDDAEICENLGELFDHFGEYDKALKFSQQCLNLELKTLGSLHPYVANSYHNIGNIYDSKGEYDIALDFYEQGLDIRLKTLGDQHPEVATYYSSIGLAWNNKGEYDKALEFYHKSLDIRFKTLGNQHPDVATSFNKIGSVWYNKGEYDKALEYYHKGLDIRLKTLENEHPNIATSYINIGSAWNSKGEYDKALEFCHKGLEIQLITYGNLHPEIAIIYSNIGVTLDNKGEFHKALELYQHALDIRLKTLGSEHPDVAYSYNNLGSIYSSKGENDKALEFYQNALHILLKNLGSEHPNVATSYNNLGFVFDSKGEYDKALEYYQQGLNIRIKSLGNMHPDIANSYNNIGVVWGNKGEYEKALEYYRRSLDIRLKTHGNQHPDVASSYHNIGSLFDSRDEYDKALEFHNQCLDIRLKTLGEQHPDVVNSYNNIGVVWDNKGVYDKALEFYKLCLDIRLKTLGNQHPDVATSYNNFGSVWNSKGEYDKALEYHHQCLDIRLKTLGDQHPEVVNSYNNIGVVWDNKGEYDKALEYYQQGLDIRLNTLGNQHLDVANSYFSIGMANYNKGELGKALEFYQLCLDVQNKINGSHHPDVATYLLYIGDCQKEMQLYHEAIISLKQGLEISKRGGYPFRIAQCYEALAENKVALEYYLQSAEIRKNDPEAGIEAEVTQQSILACIRLAKELGKENELPEWIREKY
ncbi:tetratricopeptide repeat protein [Flavobacterium sp.]|uniref:tetratricopeptide repeat protein n=1 Tax=Flavobacterium sp. TaxID=239 RepID=UPI0026046B2A|nr:tetratricopeptide repeat protein [Flavobacterium sp.]